MTDQTMVFGFPLIVALFCFAALWPLSLKWQDVSIVDIAWGPGFVGQLLVALILLGDVGLHGWAVFGLVGLWSLRLTFLLLRRWFRHEGEDARYRMIRDSWGPSFWWKSLFIVFLLQAFVQWAIVIGPIAVLQEPTLAFGWLAWLGMVVALAGLVLESIADQQLDDFKKSAAPADLCTMGLRAHIRHPNYLGEIVFWAGAALVAIDANVWLGLTSPILLVIFLTRISGAPLIEERLAATRPAYAAYRARVPGFIPWVRPRSG